MVLDVLIKDDIKGSECLGLEIEMIENGYILNICCSERYKIYCPNRKKLNKTVKEVIDLFTELEN